MKKLIITLLLSLVITSQANASNDFYLAELPDIINGLLLDRLDKENLEISGIRITDNDSKKALPLEIVYDPESEFNDQTYRIKKVKFLDRSRRFYISLTSDKAKNKNVNVQGKYNEMVFVPSLSAVKSKGDIIREHDIKLISVPAHKIRIDSVLNRRDLIGKELLRVITPGKLISQRSVTNYKIIKKNTLVTMMYETPYMEIKTIGKALEDGSIGDIIRLKNLKSGTTIQAMVNENGFVTVNYMDTIKYNYKAFNLAKAHYDER